MTISKNIFAIPALITILMSGCSSIPGPMERPTTDDYVSEVMASGWNESPAITHKTSEKAINILTPSSIPPSIKAKPVSLEMYDYITKEDLVVLLNSAGVPAIIARGGNTEPSEEGESSLPVSQDIYVPFYQGDIGSLLSMIEASTNLTFEWSGSAVVIDENKQYVIRIVQQKELATTIAEALKSMGATGIYASTESGSISYSASNKQQRVIGRYLENLSQNTALIQIQIAVINVSLTDERNTGFDWSSLQASFGDIEDATSSVIGNLTGGGVGLLFNDSSTSVTAALNLLSKYGERKTTQNLTLQTLSGVPVSLNTVDSIPYVSEITSNASDGTTSSGIETANVEVGFKIDMEALFNNDEKMVTVSMDLELSSLIDFRELSAGNQLGSITQPETQKQTLNNIIKLSAGETALLGGLIVDERSDNRQNLSWIERLPTGSKSTNESQTAVFIMLRPTVTVFGGVNDVH